MSSKNTTSDTDSSVIFVGLSQNIKVTADVHSNFDKEVNKLGIVPETPLKQQEKKPRKILQFSQNYVPETEDSG